LLSIETSEYEVSYKYFLMKGKRAPEKIKKIVQLKMESTK